MTNIVSVASVKSKEVAFAIIAVKNKGSGRYQLIDTITK